MTEKTDAAMSRRARELRDSDWTQMPDVVLPDKSAWITYRQALRDITLQERFPLDIVWPQAPERPPNRIYTVGSM